MCISGGSGCGGGGGGGITHMSELVCLWYYIWWVKIKMELN